MIVVILAILFAMILIGFPIAFAIGVVAWFYMLLSDVPMIVLAQRITTGPDSWVLLAMPLFVLAGLLMNDTGISSRILRFAEAMVGHFKGGLAMVNVLASMLFGGVSGSSVADTAALGSILIPGMTKKGYTPEISAAITSSSASIGIVIPPSIPMILYGSITGVSVGALFVAGIIPGILIGIAQLIVVVTLARRYDWGAVETFSWRKLGVTAVEGAPGLLMPAIIIGGIVSGAFTPTEAGAVAVVYGVVVSVFFFRALTFRAFYRALVNAGTLTAVVMIIISTSYAFGWVMAHEQIPQAIATWIGSLNLGPLAFLFLVCVILILMGAILHGDPLLLIMVPILYPAVRTLGIDPLHFGMVMVFCIAIGQQTPPVGSTLFVVSAIAKRNIFAIAHANIPLTLALIAVLTLIVLVPGITFFLPELTGMR